MLAAAVAVIWLLVLIRHAGRLPEAWAPHGVMLLVVVECVFGAAFFNRSVGPVPFTLDRLLLGGLVVATGAVLARRIWLASDAERNRPLPAKGLSADWIFSGWSWLDIVVVAWIAVLAVSTLTHDFRFRDDLPLRRLLFFNLLPAALYLVVRCANWTPVTVTRLQGCVLGLGVWLAVTGLCEWRGWHGLVFPRHVVDPGQAEFFGRARGPLLNPVINGMWLNAALAVACLWLPGMRGGWRWALGLSIPLLLAGSYATLTRSVWLGSALVIGLMILMPLKPRLRAGVCLAGLVAGLALLVAVGDGLNRFKRDRNVSAEEMSQSASLRPLLAIVAWEMFSDRPLAGFGFGQYPAAKKPYHWVDGHDRPLQQALPYMQHNVLFSYATETGLCGMAALLALLGVGAGQAFLLIRNGPQARASVVRTQGWLTLCVLGNYFVNGMFHDVSIIPMSHSQLLLVLGLAASLAAVRMPSARCVEAMDGAAVFELGTREVVPLVAN